VASYDRVLTLKIDGRTLAELDEWAERMGVSRSELVRNAIRYYLDHLKRRHRAPKTVILTS